MKSPYLIAALILAAQVGTAWAENAPATDSGSVAGTTLKVEQAVRHGAEAATRGVKHGYHAAKQAIEKGAHATARVVRKGVTVAAEGVERGADATARAASNVAHKADGSSSGQ
jgi:hypothetical protein